MSALQRPIPFSFISSDFSVRSGDEREREEEAKREKEEVVHDEERDAEAAVHGTQQLAEGGGGGTSGVWRRDPPRGCGRG